MLTNASVPKAQCFHGQGEQFKDICIYTYILNCQSFKTLLERIIFFFYLAVKIGYCFKYVATGSGLAVLLAPFGLWGFGKNLTWV